MENRKNVGTGPKLGEVLVEHKVITREQLQEALKLQGQSGKRLGSLLVEMGHLNVEVLLRLLGEQWGLPTVDLFSIEITPQVLNLIPFEKMKSDKVLPLACGTKLFLGMVDPGDIGAVSDVEFMVGKTIQPVIVPASQMTAVLHFIESRGGRIETPLKGADLRKQDEQVKPGGRTSSGIKQLFRKLVDERASDLLLSAGVPACVKKNNELMRISTALLNPQQVHDYALELMNDVQRKDFERTSELDFAYTFPDLGRFRINIYKQRNSVSIAARHIVETIPEKSKLGLPSWVEEFALKTQGLILITGPTGHGKTTTLACLVDIINTRRKCNIITIEDPIEYLHKHKSSNVNQREVGVDTESFHDGLRRIFRQSPDVIVIGEMRDPDSFAIALQAAETGHLVLSTMHANTATSAIDRVIDVFPPLQQQQIRVQMAENFLLVLNQRLVPSAKVKGERVLAYEKLTNSYRVRNLIREGKTHQIRGLVQQSSDDFYNMDLSLAKLCQEGKITLDTGLQFCETPNFFKEQAKR